MWCSLRQHAAAEQLHIRVYIQLDVDCYLWPGCGFKLEPDVATLQDPKAAEQLGERWQDAIMNLCDDELLFTQV